MVIGRFKIPILFFGALATQMIEKHHLTHQLRRFKKLRQTNHEEPIASFIRSTGSADSGVASD